MGVGLARALVLLIAAALAAPQDAWAGKRGGGSRSGMKSGAVHHHHHRALSSSAFFVWSPWRYPGSYYYPYPYPLAMRYAEPAGPMYIKQYAGYPDATDCPGGWARVVQ